MQKAGLHALTQHLAIELAEFGIRANAVVPAVVLSTIYKSFIAQEQIADTVKTFDGFLRLVELVQLKMLRMLFPFFYLTKPVGLLAPF